MKLATVVFSFVPFLFIVVRYRMGDDLLPPEQMQFSVFVVCS